MKIMYNWPPKNQIIPILCLCKQASYRQGHFPRHKFYVYPCMKYVNVSKLQIEITKPETPKLGQLPWSSWTQVLMESKKPQFCITE